MKAFRLAPLASWHFEIDPVYYCGVPRLRLTAFGTTAPSVGPFLLPGRTEMVTVEPAGSLSKSNVQSTATELRAWRPGGLLAPGALDLGELAGRFGALLRLLIEEIRELGEHEHVGAADASGGVGDR